MDVHQATISVAVMDSAGKLILESILETKAATILQFIDGLCGSLLVTFEEGTSAAWLYDLLRSRVANVLVCDPRKNALLKDGSKSDRIDARKSLSATLVGSSIVGDSTAALLQSCAIDAISVRCNPFHLLVATCVSNFSLLECFALTENAVGFLRVWVCVWLRTVAAVSSVQ